MTKTVGDETAHRARQMMEGIGEAILGLDADWRIADFSSALPRLLNCRRKDLLGRSVWEVSGLERDSPFGVLAQRVARTKVFEEAELTYSGSGGRRLLAARIFPLGRGVGAVLRDITDLRAAERDLFESEARYRELADGTPAAAWFSSADGELEFINQAMADALGRSREALLGAGWTGCIDPSDRVPMLKMREEVRTTHTTFHYEGRFRKADGALRVIELYGRPRFDSAGEFAGHVGMATDVTALRANERQQQLLISELNHRVNNTLATVKALVSQTLSEAGVAEEVGQVVAGRLKALAAAHDVLNLEQWNGANLTDVAVGVLGAYPGADRITVEGPPARLESNSAVTLALALHELAVNALKYGALSSSTGRIRLNWAAEGEWFALVWSESGGPPVIPPERAGFGSRLLKGLRAVVDYAPGGLICRMRVPAWREETSLLSL
ncbi:MAG TPA: HWE histidine kinase domain-containing protein [Phenylobacterium sp.]